MTQETRFKHTYNIEQDPPNMGYSLNPVLPDTSIPKYSTSDNQPLLMTSEQSKSLRTQRWVRFVLFSFCLVFLALGRSTLPDHDVTCLVDRVMDLLSGLNSYILTHPRVRTGMLIACSLFMDCMFLSTGTYWVLYAKTSRVIVTTLIFYFIRAAVQQIWYSPYPSGYYWDDPGFPSLVVPYGRSSDFFFSGHIGFVVINASEWFKNEKPWAAAVVGLGGVYTAFILIVYQAHYSIDIFTGIVCASWVFLVIDKFKEKFDGFFMMVFSLIKDLIDIIFKRGEGQQELLKVKDATTAL